MKKDPFAIKPTHEEIAKYEKRLEYFLSAHNLKIRIKLYDEPIEIRSEYGKDYYWVDSVIISTSKETFCIEHLPSEIYPYRSSVLDEDFAWSDAFSIQNEMYKKLDKFKNLRVGKDDPYWNLWHLLEKE